MYKNILFLDVETTFQIDDRGKKDPSPYHPDNFLISAGWWFEEKLTYTFYNHNNIKIEQITDGNLQEALNNCDLLVAHNAKFELQWLRACGFVYSGPIHDTMLMAYVLSRGQKWALSLDTLTERYSTVHRKLGYLVDEYLKKNIGFQDMPWETVQEYGINDVLALKDLHEILLKELAESPHLWPTVDLTHEFCQCLVEIEEAGIKINVGALDELEKQFTKELADYKRDIVRIINDLSGDTPVNLDSPEQLSQFIYSRRVRDKKLWAETFNLGSELRGAVTKPKRRRHYKKTEFVNIVKQQTEIIYKTQAQHCEACHGKGTIQYIRKDGTPGRFSKCGNCLGQGFKLCNTEQIGGLKCIPTGPADASIGGFSTSKEIIESLLEKATTAPQKAFLGTISKVSQIEHYLNNFIAGIRRGLRNDNILYPKFMQHITATGRLSSIEPNYQNQPRGTTFPIRKVVVSKFEGGCITEADARQLEFRIAGELSGSKMILKDVVDGIDVHAQTAKHTNRSRQDAKEVTFQPIYGATEAGKSEEVAKYFRYFNDRYKLSDWHNSMCSSIIGSGGYYRIPSGRELYYGEVRRFPNGSFSSATQIKNYPCQAWATADIVPIWCIETNKLLPNFKSNIILTVHDSIIVDTHPDEKKIVIEILKQAWDTTTKVEPKRRWNYEIKIPLDIEIKQGMNWLNLDEVQ